MFSYLEHNDARPPPRRSRRTVPSPLQLFRRWTVLSGHEVNVCTSDVVPVEEQRGLGILQSSILSKYRCARSPADCEV